MRSELLNPGFCMLYKTLSTLILILRKSLLEYVCLEMLRAWGFTGISGEIETRTKASYCPLCCPKSLCPKLRSTARSEGSVPRHVQYLRAQYLAVGSLYKD